MTAILNINSIEDVEEIINSYCQMNKEKKVMQGEVFTPYKLIIEMLNALPHDVWEDPTKKWLDPGAGFGGFSIAAFHFLDVGLKKWQSSKSKRHKHILKNMLYMVELDSHNVANIRKIFGENVNVCKCDFIRESDVWKTQFKIDTFHVIYGNPPYNENGMKGKGRSDVGLKVLWTKFVDQTLDLLEENGYCLFFTPNSWIELKSPLSRKMMKHQIVLLKCFDVVKSYKLFNKEAGSMPLCYYIIQKKEPTHATKIYDQTLDIYVDFDIHKHMVVPNKNIKFIQNLFLNKILVH